MVLESYRTDCTVPLYLSDIRIVLEESYLLDNIPLLDKIVTNDYTSYDYTSYDYTSYDYT